MHRDRIRLGAALGLFILALALPAARSYSDPIPYQVQPIAGLDLSFLRPYLTPNGARISYLRIDGLSDNGELLLSLHGAGLGLFLYDNGHFTLFPPPAGPAPAGFWPPTLPSGGSINQQGEIAFAAQSGPWNWLGVFVWDPQTQQYTPMALPGLRPVATRGLVFGGWTASEGPPLLNNRGEVAFSAPLSDLNGHSVATGLFFRSRDGQVRPVAIPGDTLPGIGASYSLQLASLNDSGVVAFLADGSAFTWDKGVITPVALHGQSLPGGKTVINVNGAWVNDVNQNVLLDVSPVGARLGDNSLYLAQDGQITLLVEPGQMMPGGGTYVASPEAPHDPLLTVSAPNAVGQSVFVAFLKDGDRYAVAVYRVDANGQLTRLLQDGDSVVGGQTIAIRYELSNSLLSVAGAALNGKGQLALPVAVGAAADVLAYQALGTLSLLTPTGP